MVAVIPLERQVLAHNLNVQVLIIVKYFIIKEDLEFGSGKYSRLQLRFALPFQDGGFGQVEFIL